MVLYKFYLDHLNLIEIFIDEDSTIDYLKKKLNAENAEIMDNCSYECRTLFLYGGNGITYDMFDLLDHIKRYCINPYYSIRLEKRRFGSCKNH